MISKDKKLTECNDFTKIKKTDEEAFNNKCIRIDECGENPVWELLKNRKSKKAIQKYARYLYEYHGKTSEVIDDMFDNMGGGIPYDTLIKVKEEFLKLCNR